MLTLIVRPLVLLPLFAIVAIAVACALLLEALEDLRRRRTQTIGQHVRHGASSRPSFLRNHGEAIRSVQNESPLAARVAAGRESSWIEP